MKLGRSQTSGLQRRSHAPRLSSVTIGVAMGPSYPGPPGRALFPRRTASSPGARVSADEDEGQTVEYAEYLSEVDRAAEATDGKVVSLAGGYFGVQLAADGSHVVLAL